MKTTVLLLLALAAAAAATTLVHDPPRPALVRELVARMQSGSIRYAFFVDAEKTRARARLHLLAAKNPVLTDAVLVDGMLWFAESYPRQSTKSCWKKRSDESPETDALFDPVAAVTEEFTYKGKTDYAEHKGLDTWAMFDEDRCEHQMLFVPGPASGRGAAARAVGQQAVMTRGTRRRRTSVTRTWRRCYRIPVSRSGTASYRDERTNNSRDFDKGRYSTIFGTPEAH